MESPTSSPPSSHLENSTPDITSGFGTDCKTTPVPQQSAWPSAPPPPDHQALSRCVGEAGGWCSPFAPGLCHCSRCEKRQPVRTTSSGTSQAGFLSASFGPYQSTDVSVLVSRIRLECLQPAVTKKRVISGVRKHRTSSQPSSHPLAAGLGRTTVPFLGLSPNRGQRCLCPAGRGRLGAQRAFTGARSPSSARSAPAQGLVSTRGAPSRSARLRDSREPGTATCSVKSTSPRSKRALTCSRAHGHVDKAALPRCPCPGVVL